MKKISFNEQFYLRSRKQTAWLYCVMCMLKIYETTGCPNKHGNSGTHSRSSLLRISLVIPDFKSHNLIMSARVYFMKIINLTKMNNADGHVYVVCINYIFLVLLS